MHSRIVALFLVFVASAAAAQVQTPVSAPQYGSAFGSQFGPSIAANGNEYFVAWGDQRRDTSERFDVFGSRVDSDGNLLDPNGIRISRPNGVAAGGGDIKVIATASGYGVFWRDGFQTIYGRIIGRDGTPAGPALPVVSDMLIHVSIASNGPSFLISQGSLMAIFDERLDASKARWTPSPIAGGVVASDGRGFLMVGRSPGSSVSLSVSPIAGTGEVLAPAVDLGVTTGMTSLVFSGDHYVLLAGTTIRNLNRLGEPLDSPVNVTAGSGSQLAPAPSGGVILSSTAWIDSNAITSTTRIDGSIGTTHVLSNQIAWPSIACSGNGCVAVAANSLGSPQTGITTIPLDSSGARRDGADPATPLFEKTRSSTAQFDFAALRDRPSRLIAWDERDGSGRSVLMLRDLLSSTPPRAVSESTWPQRAPALATNGVLNLLVWFEEDLASLTRKIRALRLAPDGSPIDSAPIEIAEAAIWYDEMDTGRVLGEPSIAWSGSMFVVTFVAAGKIQIARITDGGAILEFGGTTAASAAIGPVRYPVLSSSGDRLVLVWQDGEEFTPCLFECPVQRPSIIRLMSLASDGTPEEPAPITIDDNWALSPDIAWNGSKFLITWVRDATIYGRFAGPDGSFVSYTMTIGRTSQKTPPSVVARADDNFDVVWVRDDNYSSTFGNAAVARVSNAGVSPFTLLGRTVDQRNPRAWLLPSGGSAVAYQRVSDDPQLTFVPRLFYQPLDPFGQRRHAVGR